MNNTLINPCAVCQRTDAPNITAMTDGQSGQHHVCDTCRSAVTSFFFVYGSLAVAISELRQAVTGRSR